MGSGFDLSWTYRLVESGRHPSSLWMVLAATPGVSSDSVIRAAALPVGAASPTMESGRAPRSPERISETMRVFPVPGPPAIIDSPG